MKKTLTLLIFTLLLAGGALAQDNKPQIKVGGQLFATAYYDSYKSVDSREGVSYSFPLAPNLDPNGNDLNKVSQFGMSVYQTRFSITADQFRLLNADARVYLQTDFMGSSANFFQMVRLRHAYIDLRWKNDEVLFGQTNNLEMVEETISGLLTAGSGNPISVLERPIMLRYGRRLGGGWKAYLAASFHRVQTGDPDAGRNSGYPSAEARLQYGSADKVLFGVAGSYKNFRPRIETADGYKASERIGSANVTAFLRATFRGGEWLKVQGLYGSNLTNMGYVGGYGRKLADAGDDDYGYTNFKGAAAWIDFQSRSYKNFHWGLFGGYMESLGTGKDVDPTMLFARHAGLHYTGRVSPRVTYETGGVLIGLEYSLFWAKWGKTFDEKYLPTESFDMTYNNRVTLLLKYTF